MNEIMLVSGEVWDTGCQSARFLARVGDREVPCAISFEALQDQHHFRDDPGQPTHPAAAV
jgi:hypothetical protein